MDPVQALKEMRRVCKVGGIVAAREGDFGAMIVFPETHGLVGGVKILEELIRSGGSEPRAGRRLKAWALQAGFQEEQITISGSVDIFSSKEERTFLGSLYAERFAESNMGERAVELGIVSEEERIGIVGAWKSFVDMEEGYYGITQMELLYRKK
jgi:hypothetical protein